MFREKTQFTWSNTYYIPEKAEHLNELLEWWGKPMWLPRLDIDPPLHLWAVRIIKDKNRNNGQGQQMTETVEENLNCWVFASLGTSSRLNVDCHLGLIHPNTVEMSDEKMLINIEFTSHQCRWIDTIQGVTFSQIPQWWLSVLNFSFWWQEIQPAEGFI